MRAPRLAAERKRRWEVQWMVQEVRGKAAHAQGLAEEDQGSKVRPAQAGLCAACARQGGPGTCGFCRER